MSATRVAMWWFVGVAVVIGMPVAHADGKPASAINGVVAVGGRASERDLGVVGDAVEGAVRHAGWGLPAKPLARKVADGIIHCTTSAEPWKCAPVSLDMRSVRRALIIVAEPEQTEGGIPMLVLTGRLVVNSPTALLVHQRFCQQCADDRLAAESADLASQLLNELAVRTGRTMIHVSSVPTGAIVAIDDLASGTTNGTFNTFPGPHVIRIRRDGFATEDVNVDAEDGKTAEVSVSLRPGSTVPVAGSSEPARQVDESRPRWIGPAAVFAGSAVFLGMSGYALYRGFASDPKYVYTRAKAIGVITGVIGIAGVAGGVYWLRIEPAPVFPAQSPSSLGGSKSSNGSTTAVIVGFSKVF